METLADVTGGRHNRAVTVADGTLMSADRNMVEVWRAMLALAPAPGEVDDGNVVLLSSGLPVPLFNPAFITGPIADPTATVERIVEHYAVLESPFVALFRDEVACGLAEACSAAGLREHWRPPLMVLEPVPQAPAHPPELRIDRVSADTLDDYAHVLSQGFGIPHELAEAMSPPALLDIEGFTALLGSVDGHAVGSVAVFVAAGVAGIYNVATIPGHRGKGIGAAMTWAAVAASAGAGVECAILQSSEQGAPVYERMGFTAPTSYRQFQPAG